MATIHFAASSIVLSTQDMSTGKPVDVQTTINLLADDVEQEYVVGALTAGASRRTRFQNSYKATKKTPAKKVPTSIDIPWGEWIGEERAPQMPSDEEMLKALRLKYPHMFKD